VSQRYSVAGLVGEIDRRLRDAWTRVEVEAEIAQLTVASSGHAYLQLRDVGGGTNAAVLSGVCWRDAWRLLKHKPKPGERVIARGRVGVYPQRGQLQLTIHHLEPAGEGDLARQIAQRIERLRADGLLDPARKRPLPRLPRVIGVVTSPTGAALQDFLRVSGERFPAARILVAGALTQGAEAPSSVARAIDLLVRDGRAELIVVTRGGGSKEDLLAFQDEQLARFLASVPVPVVSAVGHEIDTTLADLVADLVAPTPSAAAVAVLPDGEVLSRRVDELDQRLLLAVERRLSDARRRALSAAERLRHPAERLAAVRRRREELTRRLGAALQLQLRAARRRLDAADAARRAALARAVERRRARLATAAARLDALSPLAVLTRGYAVVHGPRGVLLDPADVAVGERIEVRLARGRLAARVESG
jgi:exodeoxyribonuclease VII large subunit